MIDALYGDSSSGKSTALESLARHIHQTTGKKTRVYIGDGGAEAYNSHGMVDEGLIELFDYSSREWPMTIVKLMADLYFPKDWREPNSKLVAPPANLFDTYGLMIYEGGSVMGAYLLDDIPGGMAWQAAMETGFGGVKDKDDIMSTTDGIKDFVGDNYKIHGAIAPKHSYIIQKKLLSAIRKSKQFPGMVFWTAHPTEAPDKTEGGSSGDYGKIIGKKIIGPDFGGKAMASLIGKEFGNLLHFDTVTITDKEKDPTSSKQITHIEREYRLYTRRHYDPNQQVTTEYVAGNRAALPDKMPDHFVSKEPGDSLLRFYQTMSEIRKQVKENKTEK